MKKILLLCVAASSLGFVGCASDQPATSSTTTTEESSTVTPAPQPEPTSTSTTTTTVQNPQ
jgi:hypothetical protein